MNRFKPAFSCFVLVLMIAPSSLFAYCHTCGADFSCWLTSTGKATCVDVGSAGCAAWGSCASGSEDCGDRCTENVAGKQQRSNACQLASLNSAWRLESVQTFHGPLRNHGPAQPQKLERVIADNHLTTSR